jgi:hyperosmotically inducible periplasmic protein
MRALLIATLLIVVVFLIWVYPNAVPRFWESRQPAAEVGTTGAVDKARERGAELGEKAAVAGEKLKDAAHDAAITSKIKAKMALDDSVKARAIDVSTDGSTVTVSGTVRSRAEHDRAVALARETAGVTTVIDHLSLVVDR